MLTLKVETKVYNGDQVQFSATSYINADEACGPPKIDVPAKACGYPVDIGVRKAKLRFLAIQMLPKPPKEGETPDPNAVETRKLTFKTSDGDLESKEITFVGSVAFWGDTIDALFAEGQTLLDHIEFDNHASKEPISISIFTARDCVDHPAQEGCQ